MVSGGAGWGGMGSGGMGRVSVGCGRVWDGMVMVGCRVSASRRQGGIAWGRDTWHEIAEEHVVGRLVPSLILEAEYFEVTSRTAEVGLTAVVILT